MSYAPRPYYKYRKGPKVIAPQIVFYKDDSKGTSIKWYYRFVNFDGLGLQQMKAFVEFAIMIGAERMPPNISVEKWCSLHWNAAKKEFTHHRNVISIEDNDFKVLLEKLGAQIMTVLDKK